MYTVGGWQRAEEALHDCGTQGLSEVKSQPEPRQQESGNSSELGQLSDSCAPPAHHSGCNS